MIPLVEKCAVPVKVRNLIGCETVLVFRHVFRRVPVLDGAVIATPQQGDINIRLFGVSCGFELYNSNPQETNRRARR